MRCTRVPRLSGRPSRAPQCAHRVSRPLVKRPAAVAPARPPQPPTPQPATAARCASAIAAPSPALRAALHGDSQVKAHEDGIFAALRRRIVAAAHIQLAKTGLRVERARSRVAGTHFEQNAARLDTLGDVGEVLEEIAPQSAPLPGLADAQVEQVRLFHADHQYAIAGELRTVL